MSNQRFLAQVHDYCASNGYQPGTQEFEQCHYRLVQAEIQRRQAIGAALSAAGNTLMRTSAPASDTTRVNCTSSAIGNTVNTDCTAQ
jgi:hypothetical protein